ncbi:MAG: hypothetical protein E5V93_10630 [Mesorhizobium sp.]|nr:MAG: hypothetical protein E5V93_10630 [Mesorhizobium sp.]
MTAIGLGHIPIHAVTLRRCSGYRILHRRAHRKGHGMDTRVKPEYDKGIGDSANRIGRANSARSARRHFEPQRFLVQYQDKPSVPDSISLLRLAVAKIPDEGEGAPTSQTVKPCLRHIFSLARRGLFCAPWAIAFFREALRP